MSFFGWFKSTPQPARGQAAFPREAATGVRAPAETKDAAVQVKEAATNTAERRKNERSRLRELLYKVVRESMVRVGVLSSSFKFKVLATDPRGRKFIVMMDYRGYGKSTGRIESEAQLNADARAVWARYAPRYRGRKVVFFGRSLGSGLAASLAAQEQPDLTLLVSPYRSMGFFR